MSDLPLRKIDHLRFIVGNARQSAFFYRNAFGFDVVAYAGLETKVRHEAGYVLKQVSGSDFVAAVRHVAAGHSLLDPAVTSRVLARLRHGPPQDPLVKHLTPKEEQILELVGEGLTNRQIAERLSLAEKTVKNYVSIVLGKLGVESRTQAAVLAVRRRRPRGPS